ncbi:AAA family ATPase [cf. Phormidesmis sp. LEGE 11477]|uniref:AAA family ATPase n=1 Tax=cf. Phormidesmis sp. LEGE 11477 TaxID=1828680 RepID=UPI00187FEAFD|nr:AAA family ATPase [cf. Phormidesmis sp. LEGE 11477]MBE9059630.1 AAA family ATPase [cf. Phormidesmis sp. LEGE 11477]
MAPLTNASSQLVPEIAGYSITEQLYLGSRTAVYQAVQAATQQPVVIKVLRKDYPSFGELVQFRNQYVIAKNLAIPGIVHPLSLEPFGGGYALVIEDWGGVALNQYLQQSPLDLTEVLAIALQITEILHDLHQHRVVHKDIKPANILIHPDSKQVKLIDFSIASLLPKETQEIQNPNILEGTLAYLAPEQTGRMNRGIDYRADFYAFGVTLYQLLSGRLPFESSDPLELMHCHMAKVPMPLGQVNSDVPAMLAAILAKLMAKNAEDRYQSALGLKHDLERCLAQWKETGSIAAFDLAERDLSDRFLIPEKLYGRQAEIQTLLDAFERVSAGTSELMLVAGFSGIGKTAVVNEVHKPIVRQRGYFIKGKFDQFNRNIPLSAFVQALRNLMGQLLSESDAQLAQWQAKILAVVGENGQVLIDVIPELEQVIGKQPEVTELSGSAAQNRFNLLFQKFIEVFTTADHPLVLFLDDLQWADSASLQLIRLLMNDNGYLLILGAYRDNEVSPVHPFILTVEDLKKAQVTVNTITLAPLAFADTNHLVADTLNCSVELAHPLAELIDRKAKGNPFFTTQFLKALHEERHITFNRNRRYWECDIAQVKALSLTDDVVEFMALQLQKLPAETQQVLKLAACIGNQFDLATLAIVLEQSPTDVAIALWQSIQDGLILPTSQSYKFFQDTSQTDCQDNVNPAYRFLHDRVQQAAHSLIPEGKQNTTHLQIGRLLLQNTAAADLEATIFSIVAHWNLAIPTITDATEIARLVDLNLLAGRKAKAAAAYTVALNYLQTGLRLLSLEAWDTQYKLALHLHETAAEAAYLSGEFEVLEQLIATVLQQARSYLDQVKVYEVQILAYVAQSRLIDALQTGLSILRFLGINFPETPTPEDLQCELAAITSAMNGRAIADLAHLPAMQDAPSLAAIRILAALTSAAYQAVPHLFPFVSCKMMSLTLHQGNSPASSFTYAGYGVLQSNIFQDLEAAYDYGQLACQLDLDPSTGNRVSGTFAASSVLLYGKRHIRESLPFLLRAYQAGLETGDFQFGGYALMNRAQYLYFVGEELNQLYKEMGIGCQSLATIKQGNTLPWMQSFAQAVLNLLGQSADPCELTGTAYDESKSLPLQLAAEDRTGLHYVYLNKLILAYLFGDYQSAVDYAVIAASYLDGVVGFFDEHVFRFYDSLAQLAWFSKAEQDSQVAILDKVQTNQAEMQRWANHAPMNFQHKHDLIEAEYRSVLGHTMAAVEHYDLAITGAKTNGYIQEEALANELAAKFYLNWGKEKIAQEYLTNAYYGYAHWGAKAKVQDLEQCYPNLLAPISQQQQQTALSATETVFAISTLTSFQAPGTQHSSTYDSTNISATLDLTTILKASQTLSSEIQLDKLLATLLRAVLENAGATKGALLLPRESQWFVEAIATVNQPTRVDAIELSSSVEVPHSLIHTVKRTQKPVVIVNATGHPNLATDAYVLQHQPKSLLCTPILQQGKPVAILYLENQVTVGAFTGDRVELLNLLCTQAAISLENARLYQESQANAQELEQSLQTLQNAQAKLQKNEQMMQQQALALVQLSESKAISQGHLSDAFQELTTITAQLLGVERVSIWLFDEDCTQITCVDLFQHSSQDHSTGLVLKVVDYPVYFSAITSESILAIDDTWIDSCTREFKEGYLDVFNVSSMLDARVQVNGQVSGVICCEQVGDKRQWCQAEKTFIRSIANLIALTLESNQRSQKTQKLRQVLKELEQSQLQTVQSEKMASLGNLVAGVAHEINNPIGFLNGSIINGKDYVQDLLEHLALYQQHYSSPVAPIQENAEEIDLEFLSEDLPKLLDAMKGANDRIKSISTSLRTFSRADTEHKVSANLHEGIDSTLLILKYRLKANEHRPEISVIRDYGELPDIDCFPGQLNQVFMNLLANAIDIFDEAADQSSFAVLKKQPQIITVQTVLCPDQKGLEIRIRDNGKGMTEDVKARIFDHLFTTKRVGKGTGLGLVIAQQIVAEKHGGSLTVASELGEGTEFCIQLPF